MSQPLHCCIFFLAKQRTVVTENMPIVTLNHSHRLLEQCFTSLLCCFRLISHTLEEKYSYNTLTFKHFPTTSNIPKELNLNKDVFWWK